MNYTIWRGRLCPSKVRFFDAFFALFSILLGNYYGFGGIRISSLILIFGRHLSNRPLKIRGYQKSHFWFFWRAFLLQILLIFEDITELYMLRPLLGRTIDQKTEIRNYFLRVLVAQSSCKTAPNHLGGDQKNQELIRGFTFQADFKKGITCDQKRK